MQRLTHALLLITAVVLTPSGITLAQAWRQPPHLGYVYPAGGRAGQTVTITLGGQYLSRASDLHVVGDGVTATLGEYERPLNQKEIQTLRDKLEEIRKAFNDARKEKPSLTREDFVAMAEQAGVTRRQIEQMEEMRKQRSDPRVQVNMQLAEKVTVELQLAADAAPGRREIRLRTPLGLSNPVWFDVAGFSEMTESEPNNAEPNPVVAADGEPVVLNGQIMPGDVDQFAMDLKAGEAFVAACQARDLMPYLADAVPGWFQPTLALLDDQGAQVAFVDDFRGHPDPVLVYRPMRSGRHTLRIQDAIYRGREDFVYRLTVGRLPLVVGVFPPGGTRDREVPVTLEGWNLSSTKATLGPFMRSGVAIAYPIGAERWTRPVPFAVASLPTKMEKEPNDHPHQSMAVQPQLAIHGRMDRPGDQDQFTFRGKARQKIVAEVTARRVGSPLDGMLTLFGPDGKIVAGNDDHEDPAMGLMTHHADPYLMVTLPADGVYRLLLSDAQRQGGDAFSYQLRISDPQPGFELRITPATVNGDRNAHVPIVVQAIPRDGFDGPIHLALKDPPPGFGLSGVTLPAGQNSIRLTLQLAAKPHEPISALVMQGFAEVNGTELLREATPAEDMMQAFFYRHLVPTQSWLVCTSTRTAPTVSINSALPIDLHPGGITPIELKTIKSVTDRTTFELSDPPKGVTLAQITEGKDGPVLHLAVAADIDLKVGNLIVEALAKPAADGKPTARRVIGHLPAIPFNVTHQPTAQR